MSRSQHGARAARAAWPARAAIVAAVASCGALASCATEEPAVGPAPGGEAGAADGAGDAAVTPDAALDAAPDATADAAAEAGDGGADAGITWTHYELPETSFPNGWLVASQGASPNNWAPAKVGAIDALNLFTDDPTGGNVCSGAGDCSASQCVASVCRQRVKQKSPRKDFGFGRYQWRVYVPAFAPADAETSVGAFVYADDVHELDFECGPGKAAARASATLVHLDGSVGPALASEMLCYATSQGNPSFSASVAVSLASWHTYEMEMKPDASAHYDVVWRIDGVTVGAVTLAYGPADPCTMYDPLRSCTWQSFVSVENLGFVGDTYPAARNDAYFDWFRHGTTP